MRTVKCELAGFSEEALPLKVGFLGSMSASVDIEMVAIGEEKKPWVVSNGTTLGKPRGDSLSARNRRHYCET